MLKASMVLLERHQVIKQLTRFGFVGCSAAVTNYLLVMLLVAAVHLSPLLANVLAFAVACQVSFYGHKLWTFEDDDANLSTMMRFFVLSLIGFSLNEGLFAFFLHITHLHYQTALLLVLLIIPPITFLCNKFWVFK